MTSVFIDWFSCTDLSSDGHNRTSFPIDQWTRAIGGGLGYDIKFVHNTLGIEMLVSSTRRDMGVLYRVSGESMDKLRKHFECGSRDALVEAGLWNFKPTRIDVAMTHLMGETWLHDLIVKVSVDPTAFGAKKAKAIQDVHTVGGETLYIGSRQSALFCRIYDDNAMHGTELGTVRLEVEFKGEAAVSVRDAIGQFDDDIALPSILKMFMERSDKTRYLRQLSQLVSGRY
jgi:hypothetical protein